MTASIRPTPTWIVYGALVLVQILFGVHYLMAKVVLAEIPPKVWALIRIGSAAALMLVIARAMARPFPRERRDLATLALLSLLGVVINQLCFVEGLSRTTASSSSILMTSIPVGTLLFAVLLGREQLQPWKIVSFALAFGGVWLVLRPTAADVPNRLLVGDVLILINACSYALFLVLSRRLFGRLDAIAATALLLLFGGIGMLLPTLPAFADFHPGDVSTRAWILGALIVIFPTALAYVLSTWALKKVESSIVAFFIYLQPLIATTLSVLLLGEKVIATTIAGAGLIFLAVFVTLRGQAVARRQVSAPAPAD
jgi:drug/metabolite transporter (DMT)-like permease